MLQQGDSGYVDGQIIAKEFLTGGSNAGSLQLHGDFYSGPMDCLEECPVTEMDFNMLQPGQYIHDELWDSHGVKITAIPEGTKGYAPGGAVRVFDTTDKDQCDPDLNTPHTDFGGDGVGCGGGIWEMNEVNHVCYYVLDDQGEKIPNPWPNNLSLGNVLIIQESDKDCQDDSSTGGTIVFDFKTPVEITLISLLDVDDGPVSTNPLITVYYDNGDPSTEYRAESTGNNGHWWKDIKEFGVIKMTVWFHSSGSIDDFVYYTCPTSRRQLSTSADKISLLVPAALADTTMQTADAINKEGCPCNCGGDSMCYKPSEWTYLPALDDDNTHQIGNPAYDEVENPSFEIAPGAETLECFGLAEGMLKLSF